ncbi:MAG: DUF3471 domain-containing protein [Candidatus Acidiferrales bacterium]
MDPKLLDTYVGTYQLGEDIKLTVTREGDHLFVQPEGQSKGQIFPESNRDFFLGDAQITFVTDSTRRATELILHQAGMDQHAKRTGATP